MSRKSRRAQSKRQEQQRRAAQTVRLGIEQLEWRALLASVPVAVPDLAFSTPVNTALVISSANSLLLNDTQVDGGTLTASIVQSPSHGTISGTVSDGTLTFTPTSDYSGTDFFTYKVTSGGVESPPVPVRIAIGGTFGPMENLVPLAKTLAALAA